jgi:AraC family transcriptional regulator of adaptative response/methylated-DNA-[protein]-cysteine methyltransferase
MKSEKIHYTEFESLFGKIVAASTSKGLCFLGFENEHNSALADLKKKWPKSELVFDEEGNDLYLNALKQDFLAFIKGEKKLDFDLQGTEFQQKVWRELIDIPMAQTRNYQDISNRIGKPKATRAVGTAVGQNPISVLIPCHRIILKSGQMGAYHWGQELKRTLLEWEAGV